ncbi:hypothetical protein ANCDUO_03076 [Ancylostoma duodenale]|uniref:Uncharacterized protein n=1 Tax=Ancylostoma duodenale TaxID=51022 RepID=A0A0C2H4V8_9BILA|nr:hypothetical protein ANCDUO_03076 [Ancylostoma duodenale]
MNPLLFYIHQFQILKSTTRFNFGWSLVVAWVGILFILFASVFFICSASRLKRFSFCSAIIRCKLSAQYPVRNDTIS